MRPGRMNGCLELKAITETDREVVGHSSQLQQATARRKRVRPDAISHTERSIVRAPIAHVLCMGVSATRCSTWDQHGLITKSRTE